MVSSKILKWALFVFLLVPMLTSCNKEMEDEGYEETENVVLTDGDEEESDAEDGDDNDSEIEWEEDCFDVVYPIEVIYPDGSIILVESDSILEEIYEDISFDSLDIPLPIFPFSVILEDSSTVEIANLEELVALLVACEENEEEGDDDDNDDGEDDDDEDDDDDDEDDEDDDDDDDEDDDDEDDEDDDDDGN